jgi:hypothetical protein
LRVLESGIDPERHHVTRSPDAFLLVHSFRQPQGCEEFASTARLIGQALAQLRQKVKAKLIVDSGHDRTCREPQ